MAGLCKVAAARGLTVKVALAVAPPELPVMVAVVAVETADVVTVKVPLVAPAATVILAGTVTATESSDSVTTSPPAGATAPSVTVPVEDTPPTTAAGLRLRAEMDGARSTPNDENRVTLPSVAVREAVVLSTGKVVMGNEALVAPAATVTDAGTATAPGRPLPRLTPTPPAGAGLARVTVPVAVLPP